jgi:TRAP-type C4-dicarboxylate transport system permease small subunit
LIDRLVRTLRAVETGLLVALLSLMIALAAYQVAARNFFDSGLLWGDALVRVLVLWITLLGAMVASRGDEHIRMDLVSRFLDRRWSRLLRRVTSAFTSLVCGIFAYHAGRFVMLDYQDGVVAFASVPAWVCELILPLGAGVLCLRYLLHVVKPP